jgi:peptide/nickel transport system substrate-binding protein
MIIEPKTLNPLIGTTIPEGELTNLLFDGLVRVDDRGQVIADLATEVPSQANGGISRDGKTITYHLASGARWSDGVPLTADDVVFTFRAIMNAANNVSTRDGYDRIAGVDALDPHTVRIRMKEMFAPARFLFADGIVGAILPKHLLEREPDLNRVPFNTRPVGSGPYRLRSWTHGDRFILDANPEYFRGKPRIATIVVRIIPDLNTLLTQLRTHEIDFTDALDPNQVATARDAGLTVVTPASNGFRHIEFNTARPPLDDARVRRALCQALDPRTMYRALFSSLGALAPLDQNPLGGWADPAVRYYATDLVAAGRTLDEAGWKLGADGIRRKDGRMLTIELSSVTGAKSNEQVEVALQQAWHAIGVRVAIKNVPGSLLFAPAADGGPLYGGRYDVALYSWIRNPDPNDAQFFDTDQIPPHGNNTSFYRNAEVSRLEKAAVATFDERRRHAIYDRIQRILIRDVPIYTLLWIPIVAAFNPDLQGPSPTPTLNSFWNISRWSYAGSSS